MNEDDRPILTLDSGIGGLSVFRHLVRLLPHHNHIYIADDLGFPYGDKAEDVLQAHLVGVLDWLIDNHQPRLVVVACNTASTAVLDLLRARHDCLFVGTVPAIKPAAALTKTGMISVLATPATAKRRYTQTLIEEYAAHCRVNVVGAPGLAALAEQYIANGFVDEEALRNEISPCFLEENGTRTDCVTLSCTHFPLLLPVLEKTAQWPVTFIDPAPAIARHAASLVSKPARTRLNHRFFNTSGAVFDVVRVQHLLDNFQAGQ